MSRKLLAIVAVVAALMLTVSAAYAETTKEIGFKGGVNIASDYGDDVFDDVGVSQSSRTGFIGGAFFGLGINENFGTRFELLYAQKGSEFEEDFATLRLKWGYVEIPVLAVGTFPASDVFIFNIFAGPVFAFNTSSKIEGEVGPFSAEIDIEGVNSFDLAGAFGLGGAFVTGPVNIFFEGRATVSFTSYIDRDGLIELVEDLAGEELSAVERALVPDPSVKNIAYGIMAGISIPLGR